MIYSVDNRVAYDIEVSPNYFLVGFLFPDGTLYQYSFTDTDISNYQGLRDFVNWIEQSEFNLVGFNSNSYDDVVLSEFLASPGVTTAYRTSLAIIEEGRPVWDFIQDIRSIDLIRVLPNSMSLKKIGVCLSHSKLQELPINPHQALTPEQMGIIKDYNRNDLEITQKLADSIHKELVLRQDLSIEHGIDLRSKGEATIAELILTKQITERTGLNKKELNQVARQNVLQNPGFNVKIPSWWKDLPVDKYPTLTAIKDIGDKIFDRMIYVIDYKLEEGALSNTVFIGDRWYQMGIGGLHSIDGPGSWIPKDDEILLDADVTSYYPALMLTQNLSPRHWLVDGVDYFNKTFGGMVEERVQAKRAGDKNKTDRLKIVCNSSFGKTNEQYSSLYDPYIMASVTVSGQLALLALVAMVNDVGGTVVSANTDGVTLLHKQDKDQDVAYVIQAWQELTGLTMEFVEYSGLYQKDVNNYMAVVAESKEVKSKGVFNIPKMGGVDLRHTPNAQIVSRAVTERIVHGKDITLTITGCKDIQEFILTQQVKGDWSVAWRDESLGKMVRFYKAVGGSPIIRTPLHDGVKGNAGIVANSDSSRPLPNFPASFESITDLDYSWYIKQAEELYATVSIQKHPYMNAVAWMFHQEGMVATLIKNGTNDRKSPGVGTIDFTSIQEDERLAICTGRGYKVIGKRLRNGATRFYRVNRNYPSRTRATIMKEQGFELLFGCNLEVKPYELLYTIDENYLDTFYTETERRKVRCPKLEKGMPF